MIISKESFMYVFPTIVLWFVFSARFFRILEGTRGPTVRWGPRLWVSPGFSEQRLNGHIAAVMFSCSSEPRNVARSAYLAGTKRGPFKIHAMRCCNYDCGGRAGNGAAQGGHVKQCREAVPSDYDRSSLVYVGQAHETRFCSVRKHFLQEHVFFCRVTFVLS